MRIDFFIESMGPGGAERVTSLLVSRWASLGHDVRLITLTPPSEDHYRLDASVRRESIGFAGAITSRWSAALRTVRRIRRIRKILKDDSPDVAISFLTTVNVLVLAAAPRGLPVIVSERSNPAKHRLQSQVETLRRLLYRRAEVVVAQTQGAGSWISANCPGASVVVIPNPITDLTPIEERDPNLVVAAGRLEQRKGFDLLIEAFSDVARRQPKARLHIFGTGPLREELERRIYSCGLVGTVVLMGGYDDVADALGDAAVFVLSSRYEGFPNVLLEAMKLGTPPIAFDCPYGPADIISSGQDGVLVPYENTRVLADELVGILTDAHRRQDLGRAAATTACRFSLAEIGKRWDALLEPAAR